MNARQRAAAEEAALRRPANAQTTIGLFSDPGDSRLAPRIERAGAEARDVLVGQAEKERILAELAARRARWLDAIDAALRVEYAADGIAKSVIDARRIYRALPDTDPHVDLRFLGSLFRARGWAATGARAVNCAEGNHARLVETWRPTGGRRREA